MTKPIRIGVLGAARIVPNALIEPARETPGVVVAALAARDPERARRFASRHGIATVHDSYEALIRDPDIDAVYNPLPNGLHGRWTIAALEAGKHVLCEKPYTATADEAEQVAAVARRTGLVTMEAFHYRYHAVAERMLEILASGELGKIRRMEAWFCVPFFLDDIRWDLSLAGGALMDGGCYAIHLLRTLAGAEPVVQSATAKLRRPGVDRLVQANLAFPDGCSGAITVSLLSRRLVHLRARVAGDAGVMEVRNPYIPHWSNRLDIRTAAGRRRETLPKRPTSYAAQLRVFAAAVREGAPFPTTADDAIANMRVIDACYAAAGLPRREPTAA